MISIKNSFANCSICPLLDAASCIIETNCKDNLSKVKVIFIAENPGKNEVVANPPRPLIGKAGQIFRKPFKEYELNKVNYLITNVVLCQTIGEDGNTTNPVEEVINLCKENMFNIIEACNPDLIVAMGTSPMAAFGIAKSGITKLRGNVYNWKDYKVFLTAHPSYYARNRSKISEYENDIRNVAEMLTNKKFNQITTRSKIKKTGKKGIHRYEIPDKFYTDEFRLVDIQTLKNKQILYIFRDKNNKKIYHKENNSYFAYIAPDGIEARKIVPYDQLEQIVIPYEDKYNLDPETTYEGDNRLSSKHAMDYYHFSKGEALKVDSNIMYCDIEIDTGIDNREFPTPKEAKYPINMITTIYHKDKICYVVDNKTEKIEDKEGVKLKIFRNERELILEFIKDFKNTDPDFICGWNFISFDMEYIYNRLPKIKINQSKMSKMGEFYVDGSKYYICKLGGCVVLDQLFLYRSFTFTKKENYKLGNISKEELGMTKIDLPFSMNEMYWKALNKTIEYNIRDTELLEKLEDKLQHINLLNELRLICKTSFEGGSSPFGQVDSIIVNFLKERGLASKNSDPHIKKEQYPGAFVYEPEPGIYSNIADFDFTSLYPSIIMTYNIGINSFVMKLKDPQQGYDFTYHPEKLPEKITIIIDPSFKAQETIVPTHDLIKKVKEDNLVYTINGCFFKNHDKYMSIYSEVLIDLLDSRKSYKKKMLEAKEVGNKFDKNLYNTKQLVYKVLANALYGVIANKAFRFFDVSCAGAITLSGQEVLKNSIILSDAYMEHMRSKNEYIPPNEITKDEMYSKEMPNRKTKYIITGDTDSIFCCFEKFKDKTDEQIKIWCYQIQDFLNNSLFEEVVKKHNVDLNKNKLDLKNELIISRGLFLTKKRYAIHVTNQEGKKIDEIVYMGLEIKRSDYPSKSKEFLKELVEMILKSDNVILSNFSSFISRKELEFMSLIKSGDKTIAKPVSYTKKISSYKMVPQGVRAMETFNDLLYKIHLVGSKAYMFKIDGIDVEKAPKEVVENYEKNFVAKNRKLDVIAIPDEEACLPPYIIPNVKANLKFSFTDRHSILLKPLFDIKIKKQHEALII